MNAATFARLGTCTRAYAPILVPERVGESKVSRRAGAWGLCPLWLRCV
jgi:hypothetical protein